MCIDVEKRATYSWIRSSSQMKIFIFCSSMSIFQCQLIFTHHLVLKCRRSRTLTQNEPNSLSGSVESKPWPVINACGKRRLQGRMEEESFELPESLKSKITSLSRGRSQLSHQAACSGVSPSATTATGRPRLGLCKTRAS